MPEGETIDHQLVERLFGKKVEASQVQQINTLIAGLSGYRITQEYNQPDIFGAVKADIIKIPVSTNIVISAHTKYTPRSIQKEPGQPRSLELSPNTAFYIQMTGDETELPTASDVEAQFKGSASTDPGIFIITESTGDTETQLEYLTALTQIAKQPYDASTGLTKKQFYTQLANRILSKGLELHQAESKQAAAEFMEGFRGQQ